MHMDWSSECDTVTAGEVTASTMARYFDTSSRRPLCSVLFPEAVNVVLSGAVLYASASLSLRHSPVCVCVIMEFNGSLSLLFSALLKTMKSTA